ncbi:MAG: NAD(P)-dependent oxidoreductase [Limnochordia bacterium]
MPKFVVAVDCDMRNPKLGFDMGMSKVLADEEIEVRFLGKELSTELMLPEEMEDIDAFISLIRPIKDSSLAKANRLRWIGRFGAGFDNVDLEACTKRGILVSNAPEGVWESVSEMTLGYMLALATKLKIMDKNIRQLGFKTRDLTMSTCLFQKTLGIMGFGGIGSRLAELVAPLRMRILVYDPFVAPETVAAKGGEVVDLETLLKESDFVSLNLPLTDQTRGMLKEEHFRMMKKSAYLLNTSRGGVYRDEVLVKALEEGWIAGAGIDVYENEPHVVDNPLAKVDSDELILTPHAAGGSSLYAMTLTGEVLSECILSLKNGGWPRNILNPEAIDTEIPPQYLTPSFIPGKK